MSGTFEIVLVKTVTDEETNIFELSTGNTRITINVINKAFVVEVTNGDDRVSKSIETDSFRLSIEDNLVVLSNQRNERRVSFATIEVEDYADIAITPSVIQLNNDLFKEIRMSVYPK